ncbi:ribonucleotide-diphosphate reductase subunit alpha [Invertebrate iridescent virus 22]|uniref:Ribonucleotide-diphosphate reductase subunit alpha n=1 Tax=Invertebrate iridescent virus 22 TaxID=345198 RepID=S6DCY9_9VIRU|nr:ribonucleotide-diphosphate reductase subunit alpha [Invertebrate iridescent virus 22]CCV01762.1 ribonucleotide-diphosphate reductase subunit alpha [Invertebrate iridescent virus 22]
MHQLILFGLVLIVAVLVIIFTRPARAKINILKDITTLKTHTVNMLNKVLKVDTTKLVDFHIPDVHCDGIIDRILSPDELVQLSIKDINKYNKLITCGYTRTVGLLHGFALWSSMSKTKDLKSFKYFVDCINHIEWKDPNLFVDFHTTKSKIGKCIV